MPDGSMALIARYWMVPSGLRSNSWFSSQSVVDGSSLTEPAVVIGRIGGVKNCDTGAGSVAGLYACRLPSWNLQSAVANASAFSESVPSVLRWIISENEL